MRMNRNISNFTEANEALAKFVPPPRSARGVYTLDRMRRLMDFLGNPQDKIRIIHVAGTSGKTSTSYFIASFLKELGYKVGLTVSPHITEVNERVQIDLSPLPESEFCSELSEFIKLVDESKIGPTYFELLIAFAYWIFAKNQVDSAVVEVGLGGLLDGTNIVGRKDKVCVITDIGLDHTEVLGKTISEITMQKAGIIQDGNRVYCYSQTNEVDDVIASVCALKNAQLSIVKPDQRFDDLVIPKYQRRNLNLAYGVVDGICGLSSRSNHQAITRKVSQTVIPARMETIRYKNKTIILDGAHNPQKIKALVSSVNEQYPGPKAVLFSLINSKESRARATFEELARLNAPVVLTEFSNTQDQKKQSMTNQAMEAYCKSAGIAVIAKESNPLKALEEIINQMEDIILITGSFYLINHLRKHII